MRANLTARQHAAMKGELTYEGKPCPKCHSSTRLVTNRGCTQCNKADGRARYAKNPKSKRSPQATTTYTIYELFPNKAPE